MHWGERGDTEPLWKAWTVLAAWTEPATEPPTSWTWSWTWAMAGAWPDGVVHSAAVAAAMRSGADEHRQA